MLRRFPITALVCLLLLTPWAHAQAAPAQSEEQWKTLFMRALYQASAKDMAKAEQSFLEAVKEAQKFGPEDARVGSTLNSLGLVYREEKKYADAESAYRKALAILLKAYGPESIDVANVNFNIATIMFDSGREPLAQPFLQRSLVTYDHILGSSSQKTASVLCMLGDIHRLAKDYKAAEGPLRRCADIREANGGMKNDEMADALHSLALVYIGEGKYALAEPRLTLAEKIRESSQGITSPGLAQLFEDHASLLRLLGREKDAEHLTEMAAAIRRNSQNSPAPNASKK